MILYFSGTGNGTFIAKKISLLTNQKLVSINDKLKNNNFSKIEVDKTLVFVAPTYAWRIPRVVSDWILKTQFSNVENVYFVMSCGSDSGNAKEHNKKICLKKSWNYKGTSTIVMPENYIAMFNAPNQKKAKEIIEKASPAIEEIINTIIKNDKIVENKASIIDKIKSGFVNDIFYKMSVNDKEYYASSECIGCGVCVKQCPLNNISLKDGKPIWHSNCTQCMACIAHCPKEAIEYGNKSKGKTRYHCD